MHKLKNAMEKNQILYFLENPHNISLESFI